MDEDQFVAACKKAKPLVRGLGLGFLPVDAATHTWGFLKRASRDGTLGTMDELWGWLFIIIWVHQELHDGYFEKLTHPARRQPREACRFTW